MMSLPAAAERRAEHVFIISFDMGGGDIIRNQPAPVFKQMFNEGAGFTKEDDRLPAFFREPGYEGGPAFLFTDEEVQAKINTIHAYGQG